MPISINQKKDVTNLIRQIEFIKEVNKLNYILHKTKLFGSERNENDAGDTFIYDSQKSHLL
ncbi:hypothetical protein GCM10027185_02220 [Spirosoma pulveris]